MCVLSCLQVAYLRRCAALSVLAIVAVHSPVHGAPIALTAEENAQLAQQVCGGHAQHIRAIQTKNDEMRLDADVTCAPHSRYGTRPISQIFHCDRSEHDSRWNCRGPWESFDTRIDDRQVRVKISDTEPEHAMSLLSFVLDVRTRDPDSDWQADRWLAGRDEISIGRASPGVYNLADGIFNLTIHESANRREIVAISECARTPCRILMVKDRADR